MTHTTVTIPGRMPNNDSVRIKQQTPMPPALAVSRVFRPNLSMRARATKVARTLMAKARIVPNLGLVAPLEDNPVNGYEKFRTAWRKARAHAPFVDFLRSKLPATLDTVAGFDRELPFSNEPGSFRPMLYDAVTGMALAMCRDRILLWSPHLRSVP